MMLPLLLALASPAWAADAVELEAVTTVSRGEGDPSMTFLGNADGRITASLSCGGRSYSLDATIAPGSRHPLPLTGLGEGRHTCAGRLTLRTPDGGEGEMPLALTVAVLPPLTLKVDEADLDLSSRSLVLQAARPLQAVSVEVYGGEAGERIGGAEVAGRGLDRLPLTWDGEGEVIRIDITGTDTHGARGRLTLLPWSYAIPHEDVIFESGQAEVLAAEAPKLEAAWGHIEETTRRYGEIVDMELFVAGYTDTVGDAAANRALSERRARAIARWFRQRGFTGPIWVQGFGEAVLAVGTPDETDEPANRRAVYVLAADRPLPSPDLPRGDWERLQ